MRRCWDETISCWWLKVEDKVYPDLVHCFLCCRCCFVCVGVRYCSVRDVVAFYLFVCRVKVIKRFMQKWNHWLMINRSNVITSRVLGLCLKTTHVEITENKFFFKTRTCLTENYLKFHKSLPVSELKSCTQKTPLYGSPWPIAAGSDDTESAMRLQDEACSPRELARRSVSRGAWFPLWSRRAPSCSNRALRSAHCSSPRPSTTKFLICASANRFQVHKVCWFIHFIIVTVTNYITRVI